MELCFCVLKETALSDSLIRQPHQTALSDNLIRQPHSKASSDFLIDIYFEILTNFTCRHQGSIVSEECAFDGGNCSRELVVIDRDFHYQ